RREVHGGGSLGSTGRRARPGRGRATGGSARARLRAAVRFTGPQAGPRHAGGAGGRGRVRGDHRGPGGRGTGALRGHRPRAGDGACGSAGASTGAGGRGWPRRHRWFSLPRWQAPATVTLADGMNPPTAVPATETSPVRTSAKVGFVSLGCPKALVDSERILSSLRADGYDLVSGYDDAELVVVNTCGFITPAVEESLDAIGEALRENGRVVVTGCLGERPETILARHPQVLSVTGQADVDGVMSAVSTALPLASSPYTNLLPTASSRGGAAVVPPVRLTPRHYAYLKIAE